MEGIGAVGVHILKDGEEANQSQEMSDVSQLRKSFTSEDTRSRILDCSCPRELSWMIELRERTVSADKLSGKDSRAVSAIDFLTAPVPCASIPSVRGS